jgi:hypothetical protein
LLNEEDSILNSKTKKVDFDILWDIDKNRRTLIDLSKNIQEMQKSLTNRYADDKHSILLEDGTRSIKEEYRVEYMNDYVKLNNADNEIEIVSIDIDRLKNSSEGLTPNDFSTIRFMLTKEETSN